MLLGSLFASYKVELPSLWIVHCSPEAVIDFMPAVQCRHTCQAARLLIYHWETFSYMWLDFKADQNSKWIADIEGAEIWVSKMPFWSKRYVYLWDAISSKSNSSTWYTKLKWDICRSFNRYSPLHSVYNTTKIKYMHAFIVFANILKFLLWLKPSILICYIDR